MTLTSYIAVLLFAFPPVYSLVQYNRKPAGQKPGKAETAGILIATAVMAATLVYMMWQRIFF
jgi:hypothetical protein